ncbi:uncharacterized protein [Procambarus clarkii]|uniref:uncharacterized protein n=1 Tax=Procambarus clarkii TaxID=6728 RepID=UPI003743E74E
MRVWSALVVLAVAATELVAGEAGALDEALKEGGLKEDASAITEDKERFFGSYYTQTRTVVSAFTSTVFLSCLSGTSAVKCAGRRRRSLHDTNIKTLIQEFDEPSLLDTSGDGGVAALEASDQEPNEKLFGISIWTTTATTTSVTVFFTNTSTTIRISYYCIAAGLVLPVQRCPGLNWPGMPAAHNSNEQGKMLRARQVSASLLCQMQFATLVMICLAATAAEGSQQQEQQEPEEVVADVKLSPEESDRERFFKTYSTTTYTDVVMVTSTVFYSCLSGTSPAVCQGRRRKRSFLNINRRQLALDSEDDALLSSIQDYTEDPDGANKELTEPSSHNPSSKFLGINVWTISRTTTTVTMLYTNTSTTIRLSYFCQAGQIQIPIFNCA